MFFRKPMNKILTALSLVLVGSYAHSQLDLSSYIDESVDSFEGTEQLTLKLHSQVTGARFMDPQKRNKY